MLAGTKTYKQDQIIIKQQDVGSEIYVVLKGEVTVIIDEKEVAELGENSIIGEAGGLGLNFNRNATVKAKSEEVICLTFGRHAVRNLQRVV